MKLSSKRTSKTIIYAVACIALACVVLSGIAEAQIYSNYSIITYIQGEVLVMTKNAPRWAPAFKGQRLTIGDKIKTGRSGRAEVKFANSAIFRMRPLSQLEIPDHKDNSGKRVGYLDMKFGKVWSKVKPVGKGQSFQVKTPTAVAGIRGTIFTLSVNAITKKSIVAVLDGEVNFEAGGKAVSVKKNEKSEAEEGERASDAKQMDPEEQKQEQEDFEDNTYGNTTDTTPPNINLTSPASDEDVEDGKTTVAGSVDDTDAEVTITVNGESKSVTVGGDGKFELEVTLDEGKENSIRVSAEDEAGNSQEVELKLTLEKKEYEIEIQGSLEAGDDDNLQNDLKVTVTDQDGEGVEGAEVKIGELSGNTNDSGEVSFKDLPAGKYTIEATTTFDGEEVTGSAEVEVEAVEEDFTATVVATLEDGDNDGSKNDLTVTLTDLSDALNNDIAAGAGAVDILLGSSQIGSFDGGDPVVKKDLAPGTYQVKTDFNGASVGSAEVTVEEPEKEYSIEVTVMLVDGDGDGNKNDATVTVKDQDGEAVSGATVKVGDNSLTTASDGTCTFSNLEPGDYQAEAEAEIDEQEVSAKSETFTVEEGKEYSLNLTLNISDAHGDGKKDDLTVSVTDQDGGAVAGAEVSVAGRSVGTTNSSGETVIGNLTAGETYQVKVVAELGGKEKTGEGEVTVALPEYKVFLKCVADGATINCTVTDQDFDPVAGATIVAQGSEVTKTGDDGKASFSSKKTGDVKVRAWAVMPDGKKHWSEEEPVTIEEVDLTIRVNPPTAQDSDNIKNDVTGAISSQGTITNAEVTCGDRKASPGADGRFQFKDLPAGTYKIKTVADVNGFPAEAEDEVTIGRIKLDLLAMVKDIDGKAGRNEVEVSLQFEGNAVDQASVTIGQKVRYTSNGKCVFYNMPAGDHTVTAVAHAAYEPAKATSSVSIEPYTITVFAQEPFGADGDNILDDVDVAVQDGMGQAVAQVTVTCSGQTATSGADGSVRFKNVAPGSQTIAASYSVSGDLGTLKFDATASVTISRDYKIFEPVLPQALDDTIENDVEVKVVNSRGQGVRGARVRSDDGKSGSTGSDGSVTLSNLDIGTRSLNAMVKVGSQNIGTPAVQVEIGDKIPPVVSLQPVTQPPDTGMSFIITNPTPGQDLPEPKSYEVVINIIGAREDQKADLLLDGVKKVSQIGIGGGKLETQLFFAGEPTEHKLEIKTDKIAPLKVTVKGSINDNRGPISYRLLVNGNVVREQKDVAGTNVTIDQDIVIKPGVKNVVLLEATDSNPGNKQEDQVEFVALGDKAYAETFSIRMDSSKPDIIPTRPQDGDEIDGRTYSGFEPLTKYSGRILLQANVIDEANNLGRTATIRVTPPSGFGTPRDYISTLQGIEIRERIVIYEGSNSILITVDDKIPNTGQTSYRVILKSVDDTVPEITPILPQDGAVINEFNYPEFDLFSETRARIRITATVTDIGGLRDLNPAATVKVTLPSGSMDTYQTTLDGGQINQWVDIAPGLNKITYIASDIYDNVAQETIKVTVEAKGRIEGRITDSVSNAGIRGAKVTAVSKDGFGSFWGGTDSDGRYRINDVPYGDYFIIVVRDNYLQGYKDGIRVPSIQSANTEIDPEPSAQDLIDY